MYALTVFSGTWLEAVPFLVLGIIISTIISVLIPKNFIQRIFPKRLFPGLCFGIIGGFFLPVCDCATVPVFRSLVKKGIPLPAAITFMTVAPIINPVAILSTWYAFGGNFRMVVARVLLGIICALLIGFCFSFFKKDISFGDNQEEHEHCCSCCESHLNQNPSVLQKIREIFVHSRSEFLEVSVWQITGIAVATAFQVLVNGTTTLAQVVSFPGRLGTILSILCMIGLAFCLSLCSTSDAVICKVLAKGLAPVSQLAFLVFGPMMDIKNIILLSGLCSPKFAVRTAVTIFLVCFIVLVLFSFTGIGAFLL